MCLFTCQTCKTTINQRETMTHVCVPRADDAVTDAEVEAAARALAYWDGASGWGTPAWDGEITESAYLHGARKALTAAKEARHG